MWTTIVMACLLVACGDNTHMPRADAGLSVDATVQPVDAGVDASPDAAPDADACWQHRYPQCGAVIFDVCVPYTGCGSWTCDGQTYSYCGPGGA